MNNSVRLPHLDLFAQIAQGLEPYFLRRQETEAHLQTVEVQLNHLAEGVTNTVVHKLLVRQGDLLVQTGNLQAASKAYQSSFFEFATAADIGDLAFLESAWRLISLYQDERWKPATLQKEPNKVWSKEESGYYYEELCKYYIGEGKLESFLKVYAQYLEILDENETYVRFARSYLELLRAFTSAFLTEDTEANVRHFVDVTVDFFISHNRFIEAGELLTYTGMQLIRRYISVGDAEEMGDEYFRRAEDLFSQAGGVAPIYGLNGLFFGYLMLGDKEGFGRCAIRLLDWTIELNDWEECNILLNDLLNSFSARTRLMEQNLEEIITRLESDKVNPVITSDFSPFYQKTKAHLFLGEKRSQARKPKQTELEISRALYNCSILLKSGNVNRSSVFNLISLCYSALGDKARQITASRESAKAGQIETGNYSAVDLANLADNYLDYPLLDQVPPLLNAAFNLALEWCITIDIQLKQYDLEKAGFRGFIISAARSRQCLLHVLNIWFRYILAAELNQPEVRQTLNLIQKEQSMLHQQIRQPVRIFREPIIDHRWPLHYVQLLQDDQQIGYTFLERVQLPDFSIQLHQVLNDPIEGIPSAEQMIEDIRAIDLATLEKNTPQNEEPEPETSFSIDDLLARGIKLVPMSDMDILLQSENDDTESDDKSTTDDDHEDMVE